MREIKAMLSGSAAAAFAIATVVPAAAQESPEPSETGAQAETSGGLLSGDIIVTATRRETALQDTAISISAFGGEQLEELNIQDAQRIVDQVPNFKAGGLGGASGPPFLNIRGISFVDFSNLNEASVAVYLDDVYMAAQGAGTAQVFDTERVEVLRGPQGTLFGRNATAGVVHYVSKRPGNRFEGDLSLQYGSFNQLVITAAAGGPVTERLRARFAVKYNRDDGWQRNLAYGNRVAKTDAISMRTFVQADLGPDWMAELGLNYSYNDGTTPIHRPLFILDPSDPSGYCGGPPVPGQPSDLSHAACVLANRGVSRTEGRAISDFKASEGRSNQREFPFTYRTYGGQVRFTGAIGAANITSLTAYQTYRQNFQYDGDGWDNRPYGGIGSRDLGIYFYSDLWHFSHETRVNGETDGGLNWLAGVYYYKARQSTENSISVDTVFTDLITYGSRTESLAGFGQLDVPIGEIVTASIGLRYTDDKRRFDPLDCSKSITSTTCAPTAVDRISAGEWTGRAALEFRPTDDLLFYAQYSRGFKSGGWNGNRNAALRGPVQRETIDNYEAGMKSTLLDGRMRFNLTGFYYQFKGLQALVGSTDPDTGASRVLYINAGDPVGYGGEAELAWSVTDNFEISMGGAYLHTRVKAGPDITADGRPLNGNRLPNAPEYSFNGIVRYTVPMGSAGKLTFQADGRWQDDIFTGVDNDPAERVKAYGVFNGRISWTNDGGDLSIEAFVDNVFNKNVIQHWFHTTPSGFVPVGPSTPTFDSGFGVWGRPRTWGVRGRVEF